MQADKIKVIFMSLVMAKIQFMCELRKDREWSGNIYYEVAEKDGIVVIKVVDLALMDSYGSTGYTEFNNKDTYAQQYYSTHRECLGCFTGLLHSHHSMTIGPSSTDDRTMQKEAEAPDNNNFLSIIVYNDRNITPYSIRISQKCTHKVEAGDKIVNFFGENKVDGKSNKKFEDIKTVEILDIKEREYMDAAWTDAQKEEFVARVNELDEIRRKKEEEKKKSKAVTAPFRSYKGGENYYSAYNWDDDDYDYNYYYPGGYGTPQVRTDASNYKWFEKYHKSNGLQQTTIALMLTTLTATAEDYTQRYQIRDAVSSMEDNFKKVCDSLQDFKNTIKLMLPSIITIITRRYGDGAKDKEFYVDMAKAFEIIEDYTKELKNNVYTSRKALLPTMLLKYAKALIATIYAKSHKKSK